MSELNPTFPADVKSVAAPEASLRGVKVLVVEDNEDNSYLISMYLGKTGCQLDFARNGNEAIAKFKELSPDIILMDLKMPGMDGFSATSWIRLLEKDLPTKSVILALTAFSARLEEARCIEAGCDGILTKPIRKATLISSMLSFLAQRFTANSSNDERNISHNHS